MSFIKNGAPQYINYGADDKSSRVITPEEEPIPQHLPLFYIFAEKGSTSRMLVTPSKLTTLYGEKTVDLNDKFYNHQTKFLLGILGEANTCMIQRLVPKDAGVRSNAVIYMDVLKTQIPNYIRDSYGSYVIDENTNKYKVDEKQPTIEGHKIKFIKDYLDTEMEFGLLKPSQGTMEIRESIIPTIPDTNKGILKAFRTKYKVGETIDVSSLEYNATITIDSTNQNVVGFQDGAFKAKGVGNTTLIFKLQGEEAEESSFRVNVSVVSTNVNPKVDFQVEGVKQLLDKTNPGFSLTLTGENVANASITVNDTKIATVKDKTITGIANGSTFITVFVPATNDKEGACYIYSLQSKVVELPAEEKVTKSTMYPLFEVKAKYQGAAYNLLGFTIGSLFNDEADESIITGTRSMLYNLSLYTKADSKSSPVTFRNLYGAPSSQFSFKEGAINPNTEARIDFETIFQTQFFNETNNLLALKYWDYAGFHFYREYFDQVTKELITLEREFITDEDKEWSDGKLSPSSIWFDFTTTDKEELLKDNFIINPFICKSSKNVNYFTIIKAEEDPILTGNQKEVLMNSETPLFLEGGSDGTIDNETFEALVAEKMAEYLDTDSEVHDLAINVESIFYDTGFSLDLKKKLTNFIAVRKDTFLVLTTVIDATSEKKVSVSDIKAIGEALKARLKLCPESEYFGTKAARGLVTMGGGRLRDSDSKKNVSLSYEIAIKCAAMMGKATGNWDGTLKFDRYPGNAVEYLIDLYPEFIPNSVKPTLWNDGLVWAQNYNRSSYHIPAIQTVYEDDTSVLNNVYVALALGQLCKIGAQVWREFTGSSSLTDDEFKEQVLSVTNDKLKNKFAGIVTVVPEVVIDEKDEQRGYSWHIVFKLYGNNMKTVCVVHTEVYRSSDLEETAS